MKNTSEKRKVNIIALLPISLVVLISFLWIELWWLRLMIFAIYFIVIALYVTIEAENVRYYKEWQRIFKKICSEIGFSPTPSIGNRNHIMTLVVDSVCSLPGIKSAWILVKEDDGWFRVNVSSGLRNENEIKFRNIQEYIEINEEKLEEPLITNDILKKQSSICRAPMLHLLLMEGNVVNGVLSISSVLKRYFHYYGLNNFKIFRNLIEQVNESILRNYKYEEVTRNNQAEIDFATDELTKTNMCLMNKARELKSIYEISNEILFSNNPGEAAELVFKHIKKVLNSEMSVYFKSYMDRFVPVYATCNDTKKRISNLFVEINSLEDAGGRIIDNIIDAGEFKEVVRIINLKQYIAVPVKVAGKMEGIMITGINEQDKFTLDDIEFTRVCSNRLAEYISRYNTLNICGESSRELKRLTKIKNNFVALISHELKTPLTSIRGFSNMLLNQEMGKLNKKQIDALKTMETCTKQLTSKINSIIDLADNEEKVLELRREEVEWGGFITAVYNDFKNRNNTEEFKYDLNVDESIGKVNIDRKKMEEALVNLLSNAVKFTDSGGLIGLDTARKGDFIETSVSDTGMGISKEMKDVVFKKFTQAQDAITRSMEGLGVGLTITKNIIESHGGSIMIDSTLGIGTKVIFVLPLG